MLAIDRSLYQILIKLGSIFKLGPDGLYFPGTPQIYLKPFLPHTARTPQSPVIVIYGIFGAKIIIITRRSPYPGAQCQILRFHHRRSQCAYPLVGRNNLPDASIRRKLHLIHAELAVKATVGVRVVMPVVHYIIVIPFLQDTVMSRAVHRPVLIRFQNAALIFVRSQRMVRSSILHPVSMVMARARGIHEIIDSIPLQYKRSLKKSTASVFGMSRVSVNPFRSGVIFQLRNRNLYRFPTFPNTSTRNRHHLQKSVHPV